MRSERVGSSLRTADRVSADPTRLAHRQAAKILAEDRNRFTRIVKESFRGRPMSVGNKSYQFPKFE